MGLPDKVKIFDIVYSISYLDKPSDVDLHQRESLWGQIDYWTRTIRIYHNGRSDEDVWQTLWHEIIHGVCNKLDLQDKDGNDLYENEKFVDLMATGINCILNDNDWIKKDAQHSVK